MRPGHVGLALFLVLPGCDCQGGGATPEPLLDASVDAAVDAALDAAIEPPHCVPEFWEWSETGRVLATGRVDETGRNDLEVEMSVASSSSSGFVLEADPVRDWPDEPRIEVAFDPPPGAALVMPAVGATVLAMGGSCEDPRGYVRVRDLDGSLLWEGGDPSCAFEGWDALFAVQDLPRPATCLDRLSEDAPEPEPECCCAVRTELNIVLRLNGERITVPRGVATDVLIRGRHYHVESRGAYSLDAGPCVSDLGGSFAAAFLTQIDPAP